MARRRGNPNWGKPFTDAADKSTPSSFEETVSELRLSPADYKHSIQLKEWVRKNKNQKFVPLDLLRAWGFEVEVDS